MSTEPDNNILSDIGAEHDQEEAKRKAEHDQKEAKRKAADAFNELVSRIEPDQYVCNGSK